MASFSDIIAIIAIIAAIQQKLIEFHWRMAAFLALVGVWLKSRYLHDSISLDLAYLCLKLDQFSTEWTSQTGTALRKELQYLDEPAAVSRQFLFILRETLRNIEKHAGAWQIQICPSLTSGTCLSIPLPLEELLSKAA